MNIKSLLLGSAAVFAVASGAQAADAIVAAAPEPMEYVKVCDAFGAGYFYIPGTETCLKFGGYVRYEVHYRNKAGTATWWQTSRVRLETSTKSDSEYGPITSWFRLEGNTTTINTANNPSYKGQFKLGIGGLEAGYADPKWDGIGGGFTDWGGYHDGAVDPSTFVSYSATFGALSGWLEVTSPDSGNGKANKPGIDGALSATVNNFSGLIAVGYDFQAKSTAVEGYVTGKFDPISVKLEGLYSSALTNSYFSYKGFSFIVGASADVTSQITLAADYQWYDNKAWKIGGNVVWKVAPGFSALAEVTYSKGTAGDQTDKTTDVFLRLKRAF